MRQLNDQPDVRTTISELFRTTSGALALQHELEDPRMPATSRQIAVELGAAHEDVQVRDLFERFLPEERRTKRLGAAITPQQILDLSGDAERGKRVFFGTAGAACKNCHQIGGQGTAVGPELTQIHKKI